MKKKIDKKIIVIFILLIILIILIVAYVRKTNGSSTISGRDSISLEDITSEITTTEIDATEETGTTISKTGEITTTLEENLELHATYYFETAYVEENEYVEEGDILIEYTNGTYLYAPYDCVVTTLNIPNEDEQCTNQHYITVKAVNTVSMTLTVDEEYIDYVSVGQEATLYVTTLDKTYTGYVTDISSTATNGSFTITAEFENDGDISLGMTGKCSITVV